MAVSEKTGGTQAATLTTEHTLATITDAGVYALHVDVSNLANGETLRLRAVLKVRTGSTGKVVYEAWLYGGQAEAIVVSPPIMSPWSVAFTLTQTGGTGRSYEWAVVQA